jgi:preprotein translocase subunit YajC
MQALIVLAITFVLLWVFFILPQQRRVRAHQQLVAGLEEGDEVVLTAGIYGRITELGAEDMTLEVAPGVELRVARQAVLRRIETLRDGEPETNGATEVATGDSASASAANGDELSAGDDVTTPTDPT